MADKATEEAEGPIADARQYETKKGRQESRQRGHSDCGMKSHKLNGDRKGRDLDELDKDGTEETREEEDTEGTEEAEETEGTLGSQCRI